MQDPDWLVPDWPAPANVRALCTTRSGGVSAPPFASLNVGFHVQDDPVQVALNRARVAATLGARLVWIEQVHGLRVIELSADSPDGQQADAATSTRTGVACAVMVADCLPILLCDRRGTRVAAVHAGWRGLAQGVLEATLECFRPLATVDAAQSAIEVIAWLGPCIGPEAFEVGDEVRQVFVGHAADAAAYFVPLGGGKWLADLPGLARMRLATCGVRAVYGNDGTREWCTVSNPSRFFSYRRERITGRQVACIGLV